MSEAPKLTHVLIPNGVGDNAIFLSEDDDLTDVVTACLDAGTDLADLHVYELTRKTLKVAKVEIA